MNLEKVLEKTAQIVPEKIAESGKKPETLKPDEVEQVSLVAIRTAIRSEMPDAEARYIGGQRFPDITVTWKAETDGVEIKSTRTKTDPWTVTGGSIMEGSRVDGINEIWVLFTKLAQRVETRARPYADAVCDLAVTHSPRYILNMDSPKENSLFNKLGVTYNQVRESEFPFDFFREYLARKAKEKGGTPWWSEKDSEEFAPPFIRFWEDLTKEEENRLLVEGWALFAKDFLLGGGSSKYKNFALHLVRKHAIITTSLRDKFSAGGKKETPLLRKHGSLSGVWLRFENLIGQIRELVESGAVEEFQSWDSWKEGLLLAAKGGQKREMISTIFREYP